MRKLTLLICTGILLCWLALPAPAQEAAKQKRKGRGMPGKIVAVDASKNTITIESGKKGNKQTKAIEVTSDTKIKVDGKDAALADVKGGMRAVVVMNDDGKTAKMIQAGARKATDKVNKKRGLRGRVTSVDTDKKTITAQVGKKGATETRTISVGSDTKVQVEGKDAGLADVKAGMRATFVITDDGKTAKMVNASARKKKAKA